MPKRKAVSSAVRRKSSQRDDGGTERRQGAEHASRGCVSCISTGLASRVVHDTAAIIRGLAKGTLGVLCWACKSVWRTFAPPDTCTSSSVRFPVASSPNKAGGPSLEEQLVRLFCRRRDADVQVDAALEASFSAYLSSYRVNNCARELVILRGPPGIGKSTYARKLLFEPSVAKRFAHICSTDDFFCQLNADGKETYCFSKGNLGKNHARNQERVKLVASLGLTPIVVDNTNMSRQEMAPYARIANKFDYSLRYVEPSDIHPLWFDLEFLIECNRNRIPAGKTIDKEVLIGMLSRYEPLPGGILPLECRQLRAACGASKRKAGNKRAAITVHERCKVRPTALPEYIGINVEASLGGAMGLQTGLWAQLSTVLAGHIDPPELDIGAYNVLQPLHVTTFSCNDLRRDGFEAEAVLLDSAKSEGCIVNLTIEAVAVVAGGLACAVVTRSDPPVAAPNGKLLHVTLAVRAPWRPVQSNDLLRAILDTCCPGQNALGDSNAAGVFPSWFFKQLDLNWQWDHEQVRVLEQLRVGGRTCSAYFVRLLEPLTIVGLRFCHN
mmetsp:Transcript_112722/g.318575  ORF Transcript_112722/g.318575 Transcript_112722/m.318575 type:complete len:553 (+) Transcript_112722:52-1710(+)